MLKKNVIWPGTLGVHATKAAHTCPRFVFTIAVYAQRKKLSGHLEECKINLNKTAKVAQYCQKLIEGKALRAVVSTIQ